MLASYDLSNQETSIVRLYADDVLVAHSYINSDCDCGNLQNDINVNKLIKWVLDWQMKFNPKVCEFIRITKKNQIIQST